MRSLVKQSGYLGVGGKRVIGGRNGNAALDNYIRSLAPAAWFRFNEGITVTGSGVSQWDDVSGNARHLLQGTDAARPALQADGSILFNGTSHFLKTAAFTLNQPTTVVLVVKQVSWTINDRFFDGNAALGGVLFMSATTPTIAIFAGSTAASNTNLAVGANGVVSAVFNGASSLIQVNANAATTGNAGANNMGGFTLGADGANLNFGNIQVYEAAIFPSAISAADRARVAAGLMAKHGIA